MTQYRALLRKREFALLWGGATVSALGDGMSFVALAAIALLVAVPGAIGLWLPALGRGPTAEP